MSNMTKRVLAASLKKLLGQMPLDKITIQDLVNEAEVSRKTFYYHFQDIYDLLEWALVDEGKRVLEAHGAEASWQEKMWNTFQYFQGNQAVILNIYRSIQKNGELLERHTSRLIYPLLEQLFEAQPRHEEVAEEDRQFLLEFYSYGVVKFFLYWVGNGMKPEPEQMMSRLNRLFVGSMEDFIRRYVESAEEKK